MCCQISSINSSLYGTTSRILGSAPQEAYFLRHTLSFMKAQVFNIEHDPTLTCIISHNENSHVTFKEMEFAPSCTEADYCCYTIHVESSCLGHGREYSIIYKNEFPVCVLEPAHP